MILVLIGIGALAGYFVGAIPFGYILTRLAGLGDIRRLGSGNTGATNVLRTGRRDIAALTLLLDGGKGAAIALYAFDYTGDNAFLTFTGLAAVIGHCFSVFLLFRGGKGVATGLGVILAWAWPVGLACCAAWLVTAYVTRRSSLAGIVAFAVAPALMAFSDERGLVVMTPLLSLLVIARHSANIRRLLAGTEPRIGDPG